MGANNSTHVPSGEGLSIEMVEKVIVKGVGSTGSPEKGTKYLLCVSYEHQVLENEVAEVGMGESGDELLLSSYRIGLDQHMSKGREGYYVTHTLLYPRIVASPPGMAKRLL